VLPVGNKQAGLSLGQVALIFLVDLMVAPVTLALGPGTCRGIILEFGRYQFMDKMHQHLTSLLLHSDCIMIPEDENDVDQLDNIT
jgi:hypothetical protein